MGSSFEKTTLPFIRGLGSRLAAWVDHHDHDRHVDYVDDPRFVLTTKAQHGACPELVTPEIVKAAGPIDTVAMHLDLDGLYSGAKWVLGGVEPYPGADADARAVDTVACYQSPSSTVDFRPSRFVSIDGFTSKKIELLQCFQSQTNIRQYLEPDFVLATARYWSRFSSGSESCEPLEIIRDVDDLSVQSRSRPVVNRRTQAGSAT